MLAFLSLFALGGCGATTEDLAGLAVDSTETASQTSALVSASAEAAGSASTAEGLAVNAAAAFQVSASSARWALSPTG